MVETLPVEVGQPKVETWTASDGYPLRYRYYRSAEQPARARLVFLHGIQSHGGWYGGTSAYLAEQGYEVIFLDRRGAGLNQDERGHAASSHRLIRDLLEVLQGLREAAKGEALPTYLLGISWAGKLAVVFQHRHPGLLAGMGLFCPGFFPRVKLPRRDRLGIAIDALIRPHRRYPIPLNDPELFTDSRTWQEFIAQDPLALRQATARLLLVSLGLDLRIPRAGRSIQIPTLLLLAGRDRIIDNQRTRDYVEGFPALQKHILEYPDAHHTLEFEPDSMIYRRDLVAWLEAVQPVAYQ